MIEFRAPPAKPVRYAACAAAGWAAAFLLPPLPAAVAAVVAVAASFALVSWLLDWCHDHRRKPT